MSIFIYYRNQSIIRNIILYFRSRRFNRIVLYRRTLSKLGKKIQIEGNGTLHIGYNNGPFPRKTVSSLRIGNGATIHIKKDFKILAGCNIHIDDNARIKFGSGYINHYSQIICKEHIEIGFQSIVAGGNPARVIRENITWSL